MTTLFIWLVTLVMIPVSIGMIPMLKIKPKTKMMKINYSYYMMWFMVHVFGIILCLVTIKIIQ